MKKIKEKNNHLLVSNVFFYRLETLERSRSLLRIITFPMSYRPNCVYRLAVYLLLEQLVCFHQVFEAVAVAINNMKDIKLTEWFKLNLTDETAREFYYWKISIYYVFNSRTTTWQKRKRIANVVLRMYTVSIKQSKMYCLHLLLVDVK